MDPKRKEWNERQKVLTELLKRKETGADALALFLAQHAMVHAPGVGEAGLWSFDEEVWQGLSDETARKVPPGKHSTAWMVWHMARCEDITFNLLVGGRPQVIDEGWMDKVRTDLYDTGNEWDSDTVVRFSAAVDLVALRAYRSAVGRRTREIVLALPPGDFQRIVDPADVSRIETVGAVVPKASYLIDYWGKQTVGGLMLMPATRHLFVHLNEALRLRGKKG